MPIHEAEDSQPSVCKTSLKGRILNYDHSGRNLRVLPFRRPIGVRVLSVLSELNVGESGVLVALDLPESVQNHLMHMGFVPDALVTVLLRAPAGDPTVYGVDGMEIALRHEPAEAIRMRAPETEGAKSVETHAVTDSEGNFEVRELIEAAR